MKHLHLPLTIFSRRRPLAAACLFALFSAWVATKLPRSVICPACRWKHPLTRREAEQRRHRG